LPKNSVWDEENMTSWVALDRMVEKLLAEGGAYGKQYTRESRFARMRSRSLTPIYSPSFTLSA
jgi:hypothetical protein